MSRLLRAARSAAASLVVLALLASTLPPPVAHPDHPAAPAASHAGVDAESLWSWVTAAWAAFRGPREICQDCNLPVDGACRCACFSGGYDPTDPACW